MLCYGSTFLLQERSRKKDNLEEHRQRSKVWLAPKFKPRGFGRHPQVCNICHSGLSKQSHLVPQTDFIDGICILFRMCWASVYGAGDGTHDLRELGCGGEGWCGGEEWYGGERGGVVVRIGVVVRDGVVVRSGLAVREVV